MRSVLSCIVVCLIHCGNPPVPADRDVYDHDSERRESGFADGSTDVLDAATDRPTARDVPTSRCDGEACIVADVPYAATIHQSCRGPNGAPAEHCREVAYAGGPFTMGDVNAFRPNPVRPGDPWANQTACDVRQGVVHPGLIDAYPVSVARFRAFVRAGSPVPAHGAPVFDSFVWDQAGDSQAQEVIFNRQQGCTYTHDVSDAEILPINCLNGAQATAFCYWDGKHPVTESAWEYVATNGGTTERPFAAPPGFNPCDYGDVSAGECGRIPNGSNGFPQPIFAFPGSQTTNPAGVFGMWGGLFLPLLAARRIGCDGVFSDGIPPDAVAEPAMRGSSARNVNWQSTHLSLDAMSLSRSFGGRGPPATQGLRCARWDPEPRS